ncbi:hypothetical protein IWQ61_002115 [Dispira simplex]|nr:hypothetical protein IWQ61_002115 [Dispira simplex]
MSHTTAPPDDATPLPAPNYSIWYSTPHKDACTAATFSFDGRYAATGSADTTIKVIEVARMRTRSDNVEDKPVIKALYHHEAPIRDLAFHPNGLVLASCSEDKTIKLYDLSKPNTKRSFQYFQDAYPVISISFHPSGDFLAAAGQSAPSIRLHDVKTFQGYTASRVPEEQHKAGIQQVRFSDHGGELVTASEDGSIKVWDVVSGNCVKTIPDAHSGAKVSSAQFSKNAKYILSCGLDSTAKLWETTSGRLMCTFEGAAHKKRPVQACFTYNEDYVLSYDDTSDFIACWDSRTGTFLHKWPVSVGHSNRINWLATSPTDPGFISCTNDFKLRYWNMA